MGEVVAKWVRSKGRCKLSLPWLGVGRQSIFKWELVPKAREEDCEYREWVVAGLGLRTEGFV